MPDLLLELFSEEIPARMQRRAADDLRKLVTDALVEAGLVYEGAKAFATPRRLALTVHGLPARSPERREERKGPRVGAPQQAIDGFLKVAGLASIDEAKVQQDKKGDFYVAESLKPGRPAEELIAGIVPKVVRGFPWPKSMRWGAPSAKPGSLTWVRPLHSILCTFGPETEDPEIVRFDIDGIRSGDITHGHRFMAPGEIVVKRFDDYAPKLEKAHVVLDADRRKNIILHGARDLALAHRLELIEDEALLDEVAGLVEWPVVLTGTFDESFLEIPPEVIRTTIRVNQKCFVLRKPVGASFEASLREAPQDEEGSGTGRTGSGGTSSNDSPHPEVLAKRASKDEGGSRDAGNAGSSLAPRFILVANIDATDGGKAIVAGNERVIRARLADARHFWQTDLRDLPDYRDSGLKPLDQRLEKLKAQNIVFHEKLGTQGERVERIVRLAKQIADTLSRQPNFFAGRQLSPDDLQREQDAYRKKVERAATLAKADLVTEMVGEFPELQGLMGRYYATAQGEDPSVAAAIEDHYRPVGPSDRVPADPVAIAVALADKLDMLVGFWFEEERPTGSKDPYALRRSALGALRAILSNAIRLPLTTLIGFSWSDHAGRGTGITTSARREVLTPDLLAFFADRLKVQLREQGARHDLVDAVFALGQSTATDGGTPAATPGASPSPLAGEGRGEGSPADLSARSRKTQDPEAGGRPLSLTLPRKGGGDVTAPTAPTSARQGAGQVQDDLLLIVRRVEALGKFLDTDDGKSLLVGYRRAANILREEEKKSKEPYVGDVDAGLLTEPEEKSLAAAIDSAIPEATRAVEAEDFAAAMSALAKLRAPVDAFFDKVLVNAPDPRVRANRLRLLNKIREATLAVADFSKVEG